ncbi:MAG: lysine--tRNA ligase [Planctomycetota bacterium]|nr:lysine--tRNA ligase [Planctomycetota bacterium]
MIDESRLAKLAAIRAAGVLPYAERYERTHTLIEARDLAAAQAGDQAAAGQPVRVAGRVLTRRAFGKLLFLHLQDGSGRCQVVLDAGVVGEDSVARFQAWVDLGDHIGVEGDTARTKKGEPSIWARDWTFLSKALRPLPEKWKGLSDGEARQRERYLDLVSNPGTRERFRFRTQFVRAMRRYLDDHGFEEVDTPVLQTKVTGALARPFRTQHNAMDMECVLRIAPETWLKQCVAGGFDRVYEVARCFRNEGMSPAHLQDFTMVEWYAAYWNYRDNMDFTEGLILHLIDSLLGTRLVQVGDVRIDFTPPWPRVSMRDLILDACGIDYATLVDADALRAAIAAKAIRLEAEGLDRMSRGNLIDQLYKKVSRPALVNPVFVTDHPIDLSPLARSNDDDPARVDRYQLVANGWELINAYSELVDPLDQRARFEQQVSARGAGDEDTLPLDEDYLRCMEHGMPPMSGWGMGVERFVALLTGQDNLREVTLFPLLKPLDGGPGEPDDTAAPPAPAADGKPTEQAPAEQMSTEHRALLGAPADDLDDAGLSWTAARALFDEWVTTPSLRRQMEHASVVMGAMARARGANEAAWRVLGLLHNLDFDRVKEPERHCLVAAEALRAAGLHPAGIHAIAAHNDKGLSATGIRCLSVLDHAVSAAEAVVGLVHASSQVLPSKDVADLKLKSLVKRFHKAGFAANVERDLIERCAGAGFELEAFLALALEALQAESVS